MNVSFIRNGIAVITCLVAGVFIAIATPAMATPDDTNNPNVHVDNTTSRGTGTSTKDVAPVPGPQRPTKCLLVGGPLSLVCLPR